MSSVDNASLFNLYDMPTGRRQLSVERVREEAKALNLADLVEHATRCVDHDAETRRVERGWANKQNSASEDGETVQLNNTADILIGSIVRRCKNLLEENVEGTPIQAAKRILDLVLPGGATPLTTLEYEEQVTATDVVLEALLGPQAEDVAALGLSPNVKQLAATNKSFRAALSSKPKGGVTYDQVEAARAKGKSLTLELVARIIGKFPSDSAEDMGARQRLLGPIMVQQEELATYYRRRRQPLDVNPKTGEVEPPIPGTPAGAVQPPASAKPTG